MFRPCVEVDVEAVWALAPSMNLLLRGSACLHARHCETDVHGAPASWTEPHIVNVSAQVMWEREFPGQLLGKSRVTFVFDAAGLSAQAQW
jgi:hypothetical protein